MLFFEKHHFISPQSAMTHGADGAPSSDPFDSIAFTTSIPSITLPKTTCFPSSHVVLTVHRKNCEPFVFAPQFAIDKTPGPVCFSLKFSSSNFSPWIDSPPVPFPSVKSPPWIINSGMMRWNLDPLKCNFLPDFPFPFSPVHRARKFSAVFGTMSL